MWVETTLDSLQSLDTVRWEVIGDINLEPDQMARLAGSTPAARQLWEWRPGWLSADGGNAVRGGGGGPLRSGAGPAIPPRGSPRNAASYLAPSFRRSRSVRLSYS